MTSHTSTAVRRGAPNDAAEAVSVLRQSISELCFEDHRGDEREIADWLANKTEAKWHHWLAQPGVTVFVATREDAIIGVGLTTDDGNVMLNYVAPEARFTCASKALMASMEAYLASIGRDRCKLESTMTAMRFYRALGYRPVEGDATGQGMEKPLAQGSGGAS